MSTSRFTGLIALGPALAMLLGLTTPEAALAAPAKPRAERPTYTLGEKWIRDDGIYELVRIEDDRYIFAAGPDQEIHLTKDLAIAKVRRGQSAFEWNPPALFTWPLEVGKWGSSIAGDSSAVRLVWSIDAYETVQVSAGTFQAFRIAVVLDNPNQSGVPSRTLRLWYAPEVCQYVKADFSGHAPQVTHLLHTFQVIALDRPAQAAATRPPPTPPTTAPPPQAPAAQSPAKPRTERPTYTLGEKWLRDDGAYELIRIENDRYVFAAEPDREIHLTKDLVITRIQKGSLFVEFESPPSLAWPLEVGKWGTGRGGALRFHNKPQAASAYTLVWSVEAYEDVTVPAGTFNAFRIVQKVADVQWGYTLATLTVWYAPSLQQFVKLDATLGSTQGVASNFLAFRVVALDRPTPAGLTVALTEPADQARVTTERVPLAGTVTSGVGVARVTMTLNGREVARHDSPPDTPPPTVPITTNLPLQPGKNVLLVTATDATGTTRQEARTIIYDAPAPVAVTRTTPADRGVSAGAPTSSPAPPTAQPPAPTRPFQVAVTAPSEGARVERENVGLAGMVSGGHGVVRVLVTLNGLEVARLDEKTPQRTLPLNLALRLQEGPNTVVVTATEADGTIHQEVRTVHYERRIPLTVAIRYPDDRARLTDATTTVTALITSSKGVAKVTVTVNGVEVHQQTERTPPKSLVVTTPAALRDGPNTLVVSAHDSEGTAQQEVRTVLYEKPSATSAAGVPAPARPAERWAVVVGVGRHDHPQIPRLRYAVPDAEAIHRVLIGPAGFKPEHVLLLTDTSERKPTYRNLKWALGTFLARSAQKDDTVLIFFAGHGAPEVDQRGLERDGLAKYLIPSDADPEDLYATAFPMDELQTIFGRLESERVVVLLDTCYSGAAGGRTFASTRTRAATVDDLFLERLARTKGRAIITASRPNEVSLEVGQYGHGLFTYYLLQGLQGHADLNRDGIVSLQELYEYVEQEVTRTSRALGGNQHPVLKGELEGVLPLVKVR